MASTADLFDAHGRTLKAEVHTGIPGKVVLYDPVTNTLACEVAVKEPLFLRDGEDREYDALPTLTNVPVQWPRFGGKVVRGMLQPGDWVWLAFSEASLAEWRATGQVSEPVDARRLSIGYPFATPGAFPDCQPMSETDALEVAAGAMIVGEDGGDQILIGGIVPGIRLGKTAIEPIAKAPAVIAFATALETALAAMATAATATAIVPVTGAGLGAFLAPVVAALTTALAALTADSPSLLTKSE